MTRFWEDTHSALSNRLFAAGESGLVFWVWAFTVWSIHRGGWSYVKDTLSPLMDDNGVAAVLSVMVVAVIAVSASSLIVDRLTLPVLRLLEGYWPDAAHGLRAKRIARWQEESRKLEEVPPAAESSAHDEVAASVALRRFPPHSEVMPTRLGNIIRAGERRPATWYGLDAVIVWPQFWLVLPEHPRADLSTARSELNKAVGAFIWAIASCALCVLWLPSVLVGLTVAWLVWRWWIPAAASTYATLVSAVFDTHRFNLYDALHYPRPTTPKDEPSRGKALTRSLWDDPSQAPEAYAADKGHDTRQD
ncbi:MAG: hypothetical protein CSA58_00795 [Micrococcales bacterium]|nr:MAG: hypothetical protein CSA58_00795 [Micrococcales bacterium]